MTVKLSDEQARALGIAQHIPKRVVRRNVDEQGRNKTEARFARYLDDLKFAGDIRGYWFESIKFRLADRCWYCPDFLVQFADGSFILHEVKGTYVREDGWLKLKFAAVSAPFPFFLAKWTGREWKITRIGGRGSVAT